jgi:hypothetical protein
MLAIVIALIAVTIAISAVGIQLLSIRKAIDDLADRAAPIQRR